MDKNGMTDIDEDGYDIDTGDYIVCPRCGHRQDIQITPSVNVTLDPEMREKVLSEEIFRFTCLKCGAQGVAGFPFIYEDKETNGGFLVYYEPGCTDRSVGIEGDVADRVLLQNITMRLVSTIDELKEKVFIFESGLDDRVIELFKMLALSKMKSDNADKIPDELRFSEIGESGGEKTVVFVAFKDGEYLGILELPYTLYQSCVITGGPVWDYPVMECGMVDRQWILERMDEDRRQECGDTSCSDDCCDCCGHTCGDTHHAG